MKNPRLGSSFESFLDELGIKAEVQDIAHERVLAWQLEAERVRIGPSQSDKGGRPESPARRVRGRR